jgi:hypothetical protein
MHASLFVSLATIQSPAYPTLPFYALPQKDGHGYTSCSMDEAADNPEALRFFHVFTGPGQVCIKNDPDDPVCKVIDEIYRNSIKG